MHVIIITSNVGHTWLGAAADAMQFPLRLFLPCCCQMLVSLVAV